ncbi:MAG: metallophosphoesterase family protein [Anaerolineae bacterium]|nr:metallophosphoesterase family protein [Anaerolineae bacterium]
MSKCQIREYARFFLLHLLSYANLCRMRYAIFADVHNDSEALTRVIGHAHDQQIDRYICLGDVGIDSCVHQVRQVDALTVFGNWEVSGWQYLSPENQSWALALPAISKNEAFWITHAAPLWPDQIVTLADLQAKRHAVSMASLFPYLHFESDALWKTIATMAENKVSLMFHGHTHRQLAWRLTSDNHLQKLSHRSITLRSGDILVVGVGSVGRPEDAPGASYTIYDEATQQIDFVRVTNGP